MLKYVETLYASVEKYYSFAFALYIGDTNIIYIYIFQCFSGSFISHIHVNMSDKEVRSGSLNLRHSLLQISACLLHNIWSFRDSTY